MSNIIKDGVSFCFACLSTDRHVYPLGNYFKVFNNICELSITPSSKISLCWECTSVLRKVKLFKAQVGEAQRILNFHLVNKQNPLPNCLSNLTKVNTDKIIDITHEEIDVKNITLLPGQSGKKQIVINSEISHPEEDNDISDIDDNDFTLETDIKTENEVNKHEIKKNVRKKKSLDYKYVFKDGTINRSSFKRQIPIEEKDLKILMDIVKKRDSYKSFKYKCENCVYGWNQKNKLIEHNRKNHDLSNPDICKICSCRYPDKASLTTHTSTHNFVQECSICLYRCHSELMLNSHLEIHKKTVQCVYCGDCFQNLTRFYLHYKSMHGTFICDHCNKKCKSKHLIEKHMRHHNETHECTVCKKRYKSSASLRKHKYTHQSGACGEDAYCAPCGKQFRNVLVYRRHVLTSTAHDKETNKTKKKIPCPECGNVYARKSNMMNHYRLVHERQSKYYCTHCHKYFLNRTRYIDHMKYNHEGIKKEKNKMCNICGRGFAANRTLVNHIRTHWGSRPYSCPHPQCGAAFTQRTAMLHHHKLHTRQPPTRNNT